MYIRRMIVQKDIVAVLPFTLISGSGTSEPECGPEILHKVDTEAVESGKTPYLPMLP